jgi:glycosyltransferase involved in cell wall biosynthesis
LKYNVLICPPSFSAGGGIPAVVDGYSKVYKHISGLQSLIIPYGQTRSGKSLLTLMLGELKRYMNIIKHCSKMKVNILHIHSAFDHKTIIKDTILMLIAKYFSKIFVLHIHGGDWGNMIKWNSISNKIAQNLLDKCDGIIVTSKSELQILNSMRKKKNTIMLGNPILPLAKVKKDRSSSTHRILTFIFASRLIPEKGILDLLNAFKYLGNHKFKLKIFGDGPLHKRVSETVQLLEGERDIEFFGEIGFDQLIDEYLQSDVFIFPSYHHEGFPMSIFYALQCNMAVISTKVRPINDYLTSGINCRWIQNQSPQAIAEAIEYYILNRSELLSACTANKTLSEQFVPEMIAPAIADYYDKLLG